MCRPTVSRGLTISYQAGIDMPKLTVIGMAGAFGKLRSCQSSSVCRCLEEIGGPSITYMNLTCWNLDLRRQFSANETQPSPLSPRP